MKMPFSVVFTKCARTVPVEPVLSKVRSASGNGELLFTNFKADTDSEERERLAITSTSILDATASCFGMRASNAERAIMRRHSSTSS